MVLLRYNPALLTDDELVERFVVRDVDLRALLDAVRANTGDANQHLLVLGPRGMGKTMLVRRLAVEVRKDAELGRRWYPLLFGEESYEVGSAAELWLQALYHLSEQTGDARWRQTYEELRKEPDGKRLRDRALSQLLDFADASQRRLLLVVENLHQLLGEQLDEDDAWVIRKTLQTEPRLMLLATATNSFAAIDDDQSALYGFFKPHVLTPLDLDECRRVWRSVAGSELEGPRARPIQILTGGNVRLLSIVAAFAGNRSFKELMQDLVLLVDEHTTFFKACIEALPAQERKVFVALAEAWAPATAKEVAERARVDVNLASALLTRLVSRGAVEVTGQEGRKKRYQVVERLFNVYYLMRRHGHMSSRVQATVDFMVHFYEEAELTHIALDIAAQSVRTRDRREHLQALDALLDSPHLVARRDELIAAMPAEVFATPETPPSLYSKRALGMTGEVHRLVSEALTLSRNGKYEAMEKLCRQALSIEERVRPRDEKADERFGMILHLRASALVGLSRIEEALETSQGACAAYERIPEQKRDWNGCAQVLALRGKLLALKNRHHEAIEVLGRSRASTRQIPDAERDRAFVGDVLHALGCSHEALGNRSDALIHFDGAIAEKGSIRVDRRDWMDFALTQFKRGATLCRAERLEEALPDFMSALEALERAPPSTRREQLNALLLLMSAALLGLLDRVHESRPLLARAADALGNVTIASAPDNWTLRAASLHALAFLSREQGDLATALLQVEQAIDSHQRTPRDSRNWEEMGACLVTRAELLAGTSTDDAAIRSLAADADALARSPTVRERLTELVIDAAARGEVVPVLPMLTREESIAAAMEPLVVALHICSGHAPNAPREILEVAKDVVARIERRANEVSANPG